MSESSNPKSLRSRKSAEQTFRRSKFGTVVLALWPDKPALNLAQRMGNITERGANYLIEGKRRVTARALLVVMDEID